ncbi:HAMP domain-containing sensor histidine kinase [Archangium sp.]|uniref:sensor histidine kinase n=1 Tax=Archangium sp. TaxID=1872627 RepID=UPI002ED8B7B5
MQLFEKLEASRSEPEQSEKLLREFEEWTLFDLDGRFADTLAELLQKSFLHGAPRSEVEKYVRLGMASRLGLQEGELSRIRSLELKRLVEMAWHWESNGLRMADAWLSIPDYAREIRAVRQAEHGFSLSPIGSVFVSLSGRDEIHWLLNVEVSQSTGPRDVWRLSRATADALLSRPRMFGAPEFWIQTDFPHSWSTLRRLRALGLLHLVDESESEVEVGYEVLESGMRVLKALVGSGDTPFSVLAATLSQDEAIAALEGGGGKTAPALGLNASALATARQARLVAHEIRNALVPAKFALDSLYENLVGGSVEAEVARFRPRIDPGVERVLKFVDELLKTSELATRPPEAFNLMPAILDAQASFTGHLSIRLIAPPGIRVTSPPDSSPLLVLGYRDRFVLALVNLLRNAEQAQARGATLLLELDAGGQDVLLTVDDDGMGVPPEHRESIFRRGFSLRPGGTGEGLALVREVVESEMRGKIACVEKPGRGARFRMRLPLTERSVR